MVAPTGNGFLKLPSQQRFELNWKEGDKFAFVIMNLIIIVCVCVCVCAFIGSFMLSKYCVYDLPRIDKINNCCKSFVVAVFYWGKWQKNDVQNATCSIQMYFKL